MLDPKWTGTEQDRRDMKTLNLQQVVRVSGPWRTTIPSPWPRWSCSPLLTTISAQFRYTCNVWLRLNLAFHLGGPYSVYHVHVPSNNESLRPLSSSLSVAFANGGTAGLFWNYLITTVGLAFLYASMAELGSVYVELQPSTPTLLLMGLGFRPLVASIFGLLCWLLGASAVTLAT
jgi:hypothetical protein